MTIGHRRPRAWVDLALSIGVRGLGAPLAFVTNVFVARLLGPADYGSYLALLSAGLLAGTVAVFGANRVVTREIAITAQDRQRQVTPLVLGWSLRFVGVLSVLTIAALLVWLGLGLGLGHTSWIERALVALLVPTSASTLLAAGVLLGLGNMVASQALANVVKNGALLVGVLVLAVVAHRTRIDHILLLQVSAYLITIVLAARWIQGSMARNGRDRAIGDSAIAFTSPRDQRAWTRASSYFFVGSIAALVMARLDVVLVNGLAGPIAAGFFGAANRLVQIAMIGGLVLMGWIQPRFGEAYAVNDSGRLRRMWRQSLLAAGALAAVPIIVVWAAAPWLIGLLGPDFSGALSPLRWLLVGTLFWGTAVPAGNALLAVTGRERDLANIAWLQVGVTLALIFVLVPTLGADGGAIAYTSGLVLASLTTITAAWKRVRALQR